MQTDMKLRKLHHTLKKTLKAAGKGGKGLLKLSLSKADGSDSSFSGSSDEDYSPTKVGDPGDEIVSGQKER